MISSVRFQGYDFTRIVYCFLCILEDISSRITDQEKHELEEYSSYFIRNCFPERTFTILHEAAIDAYILNILMVIGSLNWRNLLIKAAKSIHTRIKLILQLRADVNAIDGEGRTASPFGLEKSASIISPISPSIKSGKIFPFRFLLRKSQ
jgi:hypothetical protein